MALPARISAYLKHLARGGDMFAKAAVENSVDVTLSAAAAVGDTITVTGQITDGVGNPKSGTFNVLVTSVPVSGAGGITDGGDGAIVAGSTTKQAWMTTTATGSFQATITNIVAEDNLVVVTVEDGPSAMLVLTFA